MVFMGAGFAQAQSATSLGTLTVNASITEFAALTLAGGAPGASSATTNFASKDPGTYSTVTATPTVAVSASFRTLGTATLSVQGTGSGLIGQNVNTNVIPWSAISSASTNQAFYQVGNGTAWSGSSPLVVGSGTVSGIFTDTFTYTMLNSYTYNVDSYIGTATYTLLAP
jgi:hypothetical protein